MGDIKVVKNVTDVVLHRTNNNVVVHRGYQPKVSNLNVSKPPKGGSGLTVKPSTSGKSK